MFETKNKKLRIVLECVCMPIFLACISFMLIYTVISVKVVNPKLALDTIKTVFGGDGIFEFPERRDIYHNDAPGPTIPDDGGDVEPTRENPENTTEKEQPTTSSEENSDETESTEYTRDEDEYIDIKDIEFPSFNTIFGEFEIPKLNRTFNFIMGETEQAITDGVAMHTSSYIPGYGGTTLASTHNNNVVRLDKLAKDDELIIRTHYGTYIYSVTDIAIVDRNNASAFKVSDSGYDLIFFTCYPLRKPSDATQRMVVYAELVSGPKIMR